MKTSFTAALGAQLVMGAPSMRIPLTKTPIVEKSMINENGHVMVGETNAVTKLRKQKGHNYNGKIYIGNPKQAINVAFDTGSPWISVTSDVCGNCESKGFLPGESASILETRQEYLISYEEKAWELETLVFKDDVCFLDTESTPDENFCIPQMEFYAITGQKGLQSDQDGIVGIAPINPHPHARERRDSFVYTLQSTEIIDRAVVGLFISPDEASRSSEIMIGDFDTSFIKNGEAGIQWISLIKQDRWIVELSDSFYGGSKLCEHCFGHAEVNAGFEGIGLTNSDFKRLARVLKADSTWSCDDTNCYNALQCS